MTIIAIIQARLDSKRLPKKALYQIPPESGISMLEMVVRKTLLATKLDDVAVVTPDKMIARLCNRWNVRAYVPDWEGRDVLREYYEAATDMNADVIVRITADCPLIRSSIIDYCIERYIENEADFVYNTDETIGQLEGEGSDIEVMKYDALKKAYEKAEGEEREHVTLWIRKNMKTLYIPCSTLGIRSINTIDDYRFVCDEIQRVRR